MKPTGHVRLLHRRRHEAPTCASQPRRPSRTRACQAVDVDAAGLRRCDRPEWARAASVGRCRRRCRSTKYGEQAINRGLTNLDWVSRAAVAHEAVVESFITSPAVLPMKLFTIFTSDERALAHFARERRADAGGGEACAGAARVGRQGRARSRARRRRGRAARIVGAAPAHRVSDICSGRRRSSRRGRRLAAQSARSSTDLYDRLSRSRDAGPGAARASELPAQGAPLLLDAAYPGAEDANRDVSVRRRAAGPHARAAGIRASR